MKLMSDKIIQDIEAKITDETILFFDMDGTIVDTNLANFLSYSKAIQSVTNSDYGLSYKPNNRFNRSKLKNVVSNLSEADYKKIIQKKEEIYTDFLQEIKLNKVIVDILYKHSKANKTFLVTNCRKDRVFNTLNHFGLTNEFDDIFFRVFDNDKKINKYKNAITQLDISPEVVIIFENEKAEINDAVIAGVPTKNIFKI